MWLVGVFFSSLKRDIPCVLLCEVYPKLLNYGRLCLKSSRQAIICVLW